MTRESLCLLVALTSACTAKGQSTFDYQSHVGVALTRDAGSHCLAIPAPGLKPGTPLTLADPSDSAAVIRAVITGAIEGMCPGEGPGLEDHFYALQIESDVIPQPHRVWFALLLEDGILTASPRGIHGDIDYDGTAEQLRLCTSNEGVHLTIWSGEPLAGPRRWHRYFFLGYDVEPSCTEKDYEGTGVRPAAWRLELAGTAK